MTCRIKFSGVLLGVLASGLLFVGCAKNKFPATVDEVAGNVDCRVCHAPRLAPGARDFSGLYAAQKSHHPVGVRHFSGNGRSSEYLHPTVELAAVSFFDRNGNGQPDMDEVQLFGAKGAATVECATCHKPHGVAGLAKESAGSYLRIDNAHSALCMVCHNA